MMPNNPRAIAATLLQQVRAGASLTALLTSVDHPQKHFIQALCFEVLREFFSLSWLLSQLLHKKIKSKDGAIEMLVLIGMRQLCDAQTQDHAAINETVKAVEALKKPHLKALVNATLRRFQREQGTLLDQLKHQTAFYECPDWLLKTLKHDWPNDWEAICEAQKQKPPMTLRINAQKTSRDAYLETLKAENIDAKACLAPSAITLENALPVTQLPGFENGEVSVQDQAGQFIPTLLGDLNGKSVLDACSAPGSKLAHCFEANPQAHFTAIEIDHARMQRLQATVERLNIPVKLFEVDAGNLDAWWDKKSFDCILLDAPCSATGVIRRHPDIKLLRHADDLTTLAQTQTQLLQQLAQCLRPGGTLLYTTCSVLPAENDAIIEAFLKSHTDFNKQTIHLPVGQATEHGWQILPGQAQCDGFYYASLARS